MNLLSQTIMRIHSSISSALYNPISEQEVRSTIKDNKSAAGSFDNCKVHPTPHVKASRLRCHLRTHTPIQSLS